MYRARNEWESATDGLAEGEYGLVFRNGNVEGNRVQMVMITLSCLAGSHDVGVETSQHADSNGLSLTPNSVFSTSVGRGDAYTALASVFVKSTVEDVAVFAYASDGRSTLSNLAVIGQASPVLLARLDSISNNPHVSRSRNVACSHLTVVESSVNPHLYICDR